MANLRSAMARGHYARKQLLSRDALIAWSHARRFETAVALAREFAGKRILDYGCGDGTFLAMTMMTPHAPARGVGAELTQPGIDDCRERYRDEPRLQFSVSTTRCSVWKCSSTWLSGSVSWPVFPLC
jgi:predicted RNA methylase